MNVKIGCDVVDIARFASRVAQEPNIIPRIFTQYEIIKAGTEQSLAGRFALKEAVMKALGIPAGEWLSIEIDTMESGKPFIKLLSPDLQHSILSQDVSISHDGNVAMACSIFIVETEK